MGLLTVSVSATGPSVLVSVAGEADTTVSGQLSESLVAAPPIVVRMLELCGADRLMAMDTSTAPAASPGATSEESGRRRPRSGYE